VVLGQLNCLPAVIISSLLSKTTTMLFKMLRLERSWEENKAMHGRIRQVFVTQSRVLASKVENYFSKLLESFATANGTVEDAERVAKAMERLVDEDEEENWHGTLPSAFSQLEDHHFPLFVTFDRVRCLCYHPARC
jgi:hypothetical protein